jgi:hypothetical protein
MKYLLLLVFSFATFAQEGTYEVIIRKQEAKKSSRWTLASWLLLKENMRLQDQWLAMNSSSTILEMYVGARHANEKYFPASSNSYTRQSFDQAHAAIFLYSFGLEAKYLTDGKEGANFQEGTGLFHWRILGRAAQSTNLTLSYGQNKLAHQTRGDFYNNIWGGSLTLYLFSFLGMEISNHWILKDPNEAGSETLRGYHSSFTGFIDVSFIRFYAQWFENRYDFLQAGVRDTRKGVAFGGRFYF